MKVAFSNFKITKIRSKDENNRFNMLLNGTKKRKCQRKVFHFISFTEKCLSGNIWFPILCI